jgi:hypothetical protein
MIQLVLTSRPQITVTLQAYRIATSALMMARCLSHNTREISDLDCEIESLRPLIEKAETELKNTEA